MTVLVLNGPNLGRLGTREPATYGSATYADLVAHCEQVAAEVGIDVEVRQTDDESQMIELRNCSSVSSRICEDG